MTLLVFGPDREPVRYREREDGLPNTSLGVWALYLWLMRPGQAPIDMFLVPDAWFSPEVIV